MSLNFVKGNDYGFNESANSDMFLGQTLTKGFIAVDSGTGKQAYYVLVTNRGGSLTNTPLVIGNPGGPGITSMWYLFKGLGPYKVNENGDVSLEIDYSVSNFADYLLPEFPLGSGWSTTGEWLNNIDDNNVDFVLFMNKLASQNTSITKTRPIVFHGSGYAGTLMTNMALALKRDGWDVKGVL